jgi:hypothetical protein
MDIAQSLLLGRIIKYILDIDLRRGLGLFMISYLDIKQIRGGFVALLFK